MSHAEPSDAALAHAKSKPAFDCNAPVEIVDLQSDRQFWDIFSDVQTIGKGHFAKVKRVQHSKSTKHFAAKILDKNVASSEHLVCHTNASKTYLFPQYHICIKLSVPPGS